MKDLFPDGVVFVQADDVLAAEPLRPEEAADAVRMGDARRREFALGRACARRALAGLGMDAEPLRRGADRAPRWPDGVIGSLTHTDGFCAAAVARQGSLLALGLDAESSPLSARAALRVLDASERAQIDRLASPPALGFATVAFSAKESIYKALYPLCGRKLVFGDAAIEIDPRAHTVRITLRARGAGALPPGATIEGRYALTPTCVVTSVVVRRARAY
ncbi:MAG TPA: 4'-phosphopantetheinyl transferase superfamily protein [Myxococcota bacterium]|nr:4'-phosphopantetheinyl transferase superfamily protein [Myxococcota bacterium]